MKIERLRKNHKKILIGIVLIVVSTITLTMFKSKYSKETINYKELDKRTIAVNISEDGTNYNIVDDIPINGYKLNEEKSVCKVQTETSGIENAPIDRSISIEYIDGKVNFLGIGKRATRCYLYFDKYIPPKASEIILSKVTVNEATPDFSKVAITDEGVFKAGDGMYGGASYYWRGAATTNHVIFANKCWRIVRINGDGSIRLVYNGTIQSNNSCLGNGVNASTIVATNQQYNASMNRSEYVGYTYTISKQRPEDNTVGIASNLKTQTEDWFDKNITGDNPNKVDLHGKYCNDRNIKTGSKWATSGNTFYYAAYERLIDKRTPTLSCDSKDIYELRVGAITADEAAYAGAIGSGNNSSYYLYNSQSYWTISPAYWKYIDSSYYYAYIFIVETNGRLNNTGASISHSIRPVINLRSDVTFNSGSDGTQNNPYIVQ